MKGLENHDPKWAVIILKKGDTHYETTVYWWEESADSMMESLMKNPETKLAYKAKLTRKLERDGKE